MEKLEKVSTVSTVLCNTSGMDVIESISFNNIPAHHIAICYHSDMDGIVGAVCIKAALKQVMNDLKIQNNESELFDEENITYIPLQYGREKTSGFEKIFNMDASTVIFVDFCPKINELDALLHNDIQNIFIFDHHKTQIETFMKEYESREDSFKSIGYYFDNSKAGCGIAFDQFIIEEQFNDQFLMKLGFVSDYAEDRDLWKFELEKSKEINAGLFLAFKTMGIDKDPEKIFQILNGEYLPEEFSLLKNRFQELQLNVDWNSHKYSFSNNISKIGISKIGYVMDFVNTIFGAAERGKILKVFVGGVEMFILNNSTLISEVGNKLTELDYPSCQYFIVAEPLKEPELVLSFRSTDDLPDVSLVARSLGGGGHRNSCGATLKVSQLELLLMGLL